MGDETCVVAGCRQNVQMLFLRAERRHIVQCASYCEDHGQNFLTHYYSTHRVGDGLPRSGEHGIAFDIEVLSFDYRLDYACQLSLREVGGERRLGFPTGPFEASALRLELEEHPAPRPLTHRAMVSILTALGSRLECVVIDKFSPAEGFYEAKLYIEQLDAHVVVDVRPSDAVVLAVISDAPIFASNAVVATLRHNQDQ